MLRDWIKCALQASDPWISSKDLDKGSLWFSAISDQLKDTKVGIVCLTKENKEKPWILFESGALAKGISSNKVCTFLIGLTPADLKDPLAQFNHTLPDEESMKQLLSTINNELGEQGLEEKILDQVFSTYWPQFKKQFDEIIAKMPVNEEAAPTRSNDDILTEILYTTRTLDKRIRSLERAESKPTRATLSPSEAKSAIKHLIDNGLTPEEVVAELEGLAPKRFLANYARDLFEASLNDAESDNIS